MPVSTASPRCSTARARRRTGWTTNARATWCWWPSETAWFTYYYWDDDDRAPDFARGVEIHRKPGYDPAELFFDPDDRAVKVKAGLTLARKMAGLRYAMKVVPLDPSPVRARTAGCRPATRTAPVLLVSTPGAVGDRIAAADVRDLLLQLSQ